MRPTDSRAAMSTSMRIRFWYALLLLLFSIFIIRLFYLQVIRHDYYQKAALVGQLKQYELPAARGVISAHNGTQLIPLVLNETRYTLFSDPKFIKDPSKTANEIARVIGGDSAEYEKKMKQDTRYAILAKKLDKKQKEAIDALEIKGIGTRESEYRTYPQGSLASQILGFVNDDGQGRYGLEQALDGELRGKPGQLKAITDSQGVPLATNKDNIIKEPEAGKRIVVTIDVGMQQQLEEILKMGLEAAKSGSGSALILEANTGAVKAMANYPTYDPAEFYKVEDGNLFNNAAVSAPLEVGSIMKPLTVAAGLNEGVITTSSTFNDQRFWRIDGAVVRNVEEDGGAGTKTVRDILQLSLNTGATWVLMQMGGGEINEKARQTWYEYMTDHYRLGQLTGIEQGFEADGTIPEPNEGFGLSIQYANTTFGQGMSATPLQMAAAFAASINGGTYYRPRLVDSVIDGQGNEAKKSPEILNRAVVQPGVSRDLREMLEYAFNKNRLVYGATRERPEYAIGGKTGTAQISKPEGGYYDDRFNGTYMGYVGGDKVEYVIIVRVNEPKITGYAGSRGAAPIFVNLANMLIDNFGVTPRN
jgi:cell division protein FtsI (penicillin-binding protein 3)